MTRLVALLVVAVALLVSPAEAHRLAASNRPPPAGIPISSLTHGQMAVIARNLSAIWALADAQIESDLTLRRLQDYVSLQSFACLWGLVPGSLTDEASPFNECAHAYLAGARALLLHLRDMPRADHAAVSALVGKIEDEMLVNDASLVLCRFSDEAFNTDEIVWPLWRDLLVHPPSLATFTALVLVAGALGGLGVRRSRSSRGDVPEKSHLILPQ